MYLKIDNDEHQSPLVFRFHWINLRYKRFILSVNIQNKSKVTYFAMLIF